MKKIILSLLLVISYSMVVPAQIKPLKFALYFDFDKASFAENEKGLATKLYNELLVDMGKQMDSIAKTKSKCMNYVGNNPKNADIICVAQFYKGNYKSLPSNSPLIRYFLVDKVAKDTLTNDFATLTIPFSENSFPEIKENFLFTVNFTVDSYFSSCESILDYKLQKQHKKEVVFVGYPTTSNGKKDKKVLQLIDNILNNQLVAGQISDEKLTHIDRRFIFYPFNKETKDIKPDITIQLQLVQDKTGNYELKGEFKGKDVNFKSPRGNEMPTSIKFSKKRIEKKNYTELVYKLNDFISTFRTYNVLY